LARKGLIAIVGRPNVGKSTLFNRMLGQRRAIVDDIPGVTRDRNYAEVAWNRCAFTLVDTGGFAPRSNEQMTAAVGDQVRIALSEADGLLVVVDAKTGPMEEDADIARLVLAGGKPYLLVVNKVDSERDEADATQFYGLGLGDPHFVSALSGRHSGDLLDEAIALLPVEGMETDQVEIPKIAVVGRPNVGKSTFVNKLLGEDRQVVSSEPGTTRDAIDLPLRRNGRDLLLIDTAGLRRPARAKDQVEHFSALRTAAAVERCHTAILLVDAQEGCTVQDVKIMNRATELGKGALLVVNKWDLVEKDSKTAGTYKKTMIDRFPSLRDYPVSMISALTGQRTWRTVDTALEVCDRRSYRIPTGELNRFLGEIRETSPPPSKRGKLSRMYYAVQPRSEPPTILFFTSRPKDVPEHYRKFLERRLREQFNFSGTPLRIIFRQK
jgi:GTPase